MSEETNVIGFGRRDVLLTAGADRSPRQLNSSRPQPAQERWSNREKPLFHHPVCFPNPQRHVPFGACRRPRRSTSCYVYVSHFSRR